MSWVMTGPLKINLDRVRTAFLDGNTLTLSFGKSDDEQETFVFSGEVAQKIWDKIAADDVGRATVEWRTVSGIERRIKT